jgi:hypothetical protein
VANLTEPHNGQIALFQKITRSGAPQKVLAYLNNSSDGDHLAYFGASVMWRGCVMTGECKLGPYKESFRRYLLGATPFPPEAVISVGLLDRSPNVDARAWISEPTSTKASFGWIHGFMIAGLAYRCWIGKALPRKWQQVSLGSANPTKYVSILKPENCADFLAAVGVAGSAQPRGKLAKSQPALA